jgi:uncharacterized protein (DUF2336 family)
MVKPLIKKVEHAVAIGTDRHRQSMLRRITTLFSDHATHLGEIELQPFAAVMLHLARNVDPAGRASFARTIADMGNAPRSVVRDLAFDSEMTIAGPVLARSARLTEDDLIRIARVASLSHLDAVSRRQILSEPITEILLTRAAIAAVRRIAGNESARLSEAGFGLLMNRAQDDQVLRAILGLRRTVPEGCLIAFPEAAIPGSGIDRDEQAIGTLIVGGQVDEALEVVARVAGVSLESARQAFRSENLDRLLFLVRAADLGWGTLKSLIQVQPTRRRLKPEEMRAQFEAFQALPVATARRSLEFVSAPDIARVA